MGLPASGSDSKYRLIVKKVALPSEIAGRSSYGNSNEEKNIDLDTEANGNRLFDKNSFTHIYTEVKQIDN